MEPLLVGVFTLGGVLVGSVGTLLIETLTWRRSEALKTRLELARTIELIWGDQSYTTLDAHLLQLQVRLSALGIQPSLVTALREHGVTCFRKASDTYESSFGEHRGIDVTLLDDFRSVVEDIDGRLASVTRVSLWRLRGPV